MTLTPMRSVARVALPHTIIIISSLILVAALLTWFVPSGEYDRAMKEGRTVVVPNSYHAVPSAPQGVVKVFLAPLKGFVHAAEIIAFVLFIGGSIALIQRTGAVDAGLRRVVNVLAARPKLRMLAIPVLMTLFSLGGATFGMSEEVLAFILIFIPLARSLGYDSIVGVAIPFVGAGAGFSGAFFNPFTVGIAQGIAELPIFSGLEYRLVVWAVVTAVAIWFVMRYAKRVYENPERSPVYDIDSARDESSLHSVRHRRTESGFTFRHGLVHVTVLVGMVLLIYGVMRHEWYIAEISALFLALGIAAAAIGRLRLNDAAASFIAGAKDMVAAALMIGLSRGILIVATDGKIIDTVMNALSGAVVQFHPIVSAHMMFGVQMMLNFLVPSGSGQAALSMPIMAPLSDLIGITRQTAVLAFQFGDGFTTLITPTSGVTMGVLGIAKIPWERWAWWILPLQLLFALAALLLLIPPVLMNWGPH